MVTLQDGTFKVLIFKKSAVKFLILKSIVSFSGFSVFFYFPAIDIMAGKYIVLRINFQKSLKCKEKNLILRRKFLTGKTRGGLKFSAFVWVRVGV